MKKNLSLFLVSLIGLLFATHITNAETGTTIIAKWKDNKQGAYTLRFDDSMMSHKDHTIPNLVKRELVGSFFINPATNRYGYGIDTWENLASRIGIELCPHTMNHIGAADLEEADYEIGESFRTVWKLNPPDKSKLYPFSRGGATSWPSGYRETIQRKYPVADYSNEAVRYSGGDNRNELIDFAKKAMKDEAWHMVLTHGTGPNLEWLGFEVSNFEALLDYLASVKDKLWVGNIGDVYKYVMEKKSARISIIRSDDKSIELNLTSDIDPEFFDYPLTLITDVPTEWIYCHVRQGELQSIYPVKSGKVMYKALPNRGEIRLMGSGMDETPPGKVDIRDGTAEDIDISFFTTQISANWESAEDKESGISRYWYKIGTTPGGSEVLDWIDNGLVRTFTTSRTNLFLIRGEKYYVTVKSVNGVGLSSESTSDGVTVTITPGYISFNEDFDNGYLSQWHEKRTKAGSDKNIIYLTDRAARQGKYGMQCHLQEKQNGRPYLAKHNVSECEEVFTRFYFKLSTDLKLSPDNGSFQLLELRDSSGDYVAQVSLGYKKDIGFHVSASGQDNSGYNASLPGARDDYPLSFIPVNVEEWVRIDLRTIADERKGGVEFWVNGIRTSCITNRCTIGQAARSLYIGALSISDDTFSGDIFIDDIAVSDSYLK
jgi:hypothetical protein